MKGRNIVALVLFIALWFMAPLYHRWAGHPDEASWVQLWMVPSGFVGIVLCLINFKAKNKYVLVGIYIVFLVHLLIGLGLHPR